MEQQQQQHANTSSQPQMEGMESEGMGMDNASTLQLKQLQADLNVSPQVQQLKAIQMRINQSAQQQQAMQRKTAIASNAAAGQSAQGGLPENLRMGIEQMSGMDMSDVKVHRNSSKAADAGALAYAQGNDIHLGPGQEQHLAHEAWHVVQQRQGRVQATTESPNGLPVNDDNSLEREADTMGAKALQMKPDSSQSAQVQEGKSGGALQRKAATNEVVQRVVTEVVPKLDKKEEKKEEKIIEDEKIPKKDDIEIEVELEDEKSKETSHSNVNDSKMELEEKKEITAYDIQKIDYVNIVGRPEGPYSGTMGDHSTAFVVHTEGFKTQLPGLTFEEGFKLVAHQFQQMQNLPGWKLLDNLPEEHKKLFIDTAKKLEKLLSTDAKKVTATVILRLQKAINEYLELRELLPLATIKTKEEMEGKNGKGKGESHAAKPLVSSINSDVDKTSILDAIVALFDADTAAICIKTQDQDLLLKMAPGLPNNASSEEIQKLFIVQHIGSINISFPHLKKKGLIKENDVANALVKKIDEAKNAVKEDRKKKRSNSKSMNKPKTKKSKNEDIDTSTLFGEKKEGESQLEKETEVDEMAWIGQVPRSMAVLVDLNENEEIIQVEFAGRTPSPFSSTEGMGAHSIAWILHLDLVRKKLIGKKLKAALAEMENVLIPDAKGLRKKREAVFQIEESEEFDEVAEYQLELLDDAEKTLNGIPKVDAIQDDSALQLTVLQKEINAYLTYINYIPGSTMNKADTNGKGEGTWRKHLVEFEKGTGKTLSTLQAAVNGLMDIEEMGTEQEKMIKGELKSMVKECYPKSYAAYYENDMTNILPEEEKKKKKRSKKDEEFEISDIEEGNSETEFD